MMRRKSSKRSRGNATECDGLTQVLAAEPDWRSRLTAVDLRALSPLKWQHINPYGHSP